MGQNSCLCFAGTDRRGYVSKCYCGIFSLQSHNRDVLTSWLRVTSVFCN
jgi:hypothetical protein